MRAYPVDILRLPTWNDAMHFAMFIGLSRGAADTETKRRHMVSIRRATGDGADGRENESEKIRMLLT